MVVMALDHVRDYFLDSRYTPASAALRLSNLPWFYTRWITHFCAPVFFLLAGTGVGLALARGRTPSQTSRFLLTRGLWLVFLEVTVIAVAWRFSLQITPIMAMVIWALGWSMVCLGALIRLPRTILLLVSIAMIAFHNILDGVMPESFGAFAPLWAVLHVYGTALPNVLFVSYPLLPWIGVMAIGYLLADVYGWEHDRRQRLLLRLGIGATVAFVVLRGINGYGDYAPWTAQPSVGATVTSFLNAEKYPPSLDFLLMTLGPMLVVLALLERARGPLARWVTVFGRVPMFYYVLHLYLIHALASGIAVVSNAFRAAPATGAQAWSGVTLPGLYLVWALVIVVLYFPCRWFAAVKAQRRDWWLSYL